ncbi:hypothetical protein GQ43DRAFT_398919, partial [Delitschia confertaspora ATCC 74209]
MPPIFNALIRTHHITSRKKIAALRKAASHHRVYALLRSGGCPGIMYCEGGGEAAVKEWVATVQRLRYKDFQLVRKTGEVEMEKGEEKREGVGMGKRTGREEKWGKLEELESVKEFGGRMEELGVWEWWRRGMGYV